MFVISYDVKYEGRYDNPLASGTAVATFEEKVSPLAISPIEKLVISL